MIRRGGNFAAALYNLFKLLLVVSVRILGSTREFKVGSGLVAVIHSGCQSVFGSGL